MDAAIPAEGSKPISECSQLITESSSKVVKNIQQIIKDSPLIEKDSAAEWICSLPAFCILVLVVALGVGELVSARLVEVGEYIWQDYYKLRHDPLAPSCDPNINIDAAVAAKLNKSQGPKDEFDLFEGGPNPTEIRTAIENAAQQCRHSHAEYHAIAQRITPEVKIFRWVDTSIGTIVTLGVLYKKYCLAVLVLLCATATTLFQHHLALRSITSHLDYRVSTLAQFIANIFLLLSSIAFLLGENKSISQGVVVDDMQIHYIWIIGFSALALLSLRKTLQIPDHLEKGGDLLKAFLAVPLYTFMCLMAGVSFILDGHYAGISIYLSQMMELSTLFLNLGLYIWVGMLLKQTQFVHKCIQLLRVWQLPPEVLAIVILICSVYPTAFTGASGVFVIAAGGIIFHELKMAGARQQYCLAVTAMSGSMGVVFRPCLLVVIIAALNTQVTTQELYQWGGKVFILSILLFSAVSLLTKTGQSVAAPFSRAFPKMLGELPPLIPYILTTGTVLAVFYFLLNATLNEFSAPIIMPFILVTLLFFERIKNKNLLKLGEVVYGIEEGVRDTVRKATNETTIQIGALLMLMALSVSIGGVLERSEFLMYLPIDFSSTWITMLMLVTILIFVGMIMDPYGAVILVSATIAPLAYQHHINPVHFWMVALVSFELGYLTPPVALNHLLTRQVVGEREFAEPEQVSAQNLLLGTIWYRFERYLLPITVMGLTLFAVAFVPLMFQHYVTTG